MGGVLIEESHGGCLSRANCGCAVAIRVAHGSDRSGTGRYVASARSSMSSADNKTNLPRTAQLGMSCPRPEPTHPRRSGPRRATSFRAHARPPASDRRAGDRGGAVAGPVRPRDAFRVIRTPRRTHAQLRFVRSLSDQRRFASRRAVLGFAAAAVPAALLATGAAPASAATAVGGERLGLDGIQVSLGGAPRLPHLAAQSWLVADYENGEVLASYRAPLYCRPPPRSRCSSRTPCSPSSARR